MRIFKYIITVKRRLTELINGIESSIRSHLR
jgi:hypothetical protein